MLRGRTAGEQTKDSQDRFHRHLIDVAYGKTVAALSLYRSLRAGKTRLAWRIPGPQADAGARMSASALSPESLLVRNSASQGAFRP